jgi:hypothetical protein
VQTVQKVSVPSKSSIIMTISGDGEGIAAGRMVAVGDGISMGRAAPVGEGTSVDKMADVGAAVVSTAAQPTVRTNPNRGNILEIRMRSFAIIFRETDPQIAAGILSRIKQTFYLAPRRFACVFYPKYFPPRGNAIPDIN